MGRSKESSRQKRSAESKHFDSYAKRHAGNTAHEFSNLPNENNAAPNNVDVSTQSFCNVATHAQIPYHSWTFYFFNQVYNENSSTVSKINAFIDFIERNTQQSEETVDLEADFNVDINLCLFDRMLMQKWPSFIVDINTNPQQTLNCMRVALFEVMVQRSTAFTISSFTRIFRTLRLNRINIINHESLNALSQFNLNAYGKLISISGIVINASLPKVNSAFVVLVCYCGREVIGKQENGAPIVTPRKCDVCRKGNFKRLLHSIHEFMKEEQIIQIKEHRSTDQKIEDDASSTDIISVKLSDTLVNKFIPGDNIRVIGIPRITLGALKSTTPGLCPLYIDAISTSSANEEVYGVVDNISAERPFNMNIIEEILSEPDILGLLVKSLCPTVQGHEIIKAALILELFSGGFECGSTRDYIHTLIIGDLGLSKTQLLRKCAHVAPKGAYIRGSAMKYLEPQMINIREMGIKDLRFESGAFTLANRSVCCIDELDKISAEHQSIHMCMENRAVNITNSEMKLELEAETAIVGMIDPMKKRYDPSKTVIENVNVSQEFLSRFDMVFVMRDYPDTYRDKMMCDRVLDVHTKRKKITDRQQYSGSTLMSESSSKSSRTLMERLTTHDELRTEILPQKIFQMYINYARMYVNPQISSHLKKAIALFFLVRYETHKKFVNTERFIRSLIILSQARAKLALRAEVTEEDFCDVVEIWQHTIFVQKKNQSGIQPLTSSSNSNKLTKNKVNQFLTQLRTESESLGKTSFTKDELQNVANKENVTGHIFSTLLTQLNEKGYLLKLSSNMYKFVTN